MTLVPPHVVYVTNGSDPGAIVTALIALGGAIVGALLSTGTQLLIAARQLSRDNATHEREVMIAARMMVVDLTRAWSNITYCVDHEEWWRSTGLGARMTPEDRRLVLGELTPEEFSAVDLAEGAVDHWYGIREYELAKQEGYSSMSITSQLEKLREMLGWIDEAMKALRRLTGDPESRESSVASDETADTSHQGDSRP